MSIQLSIVRTYFRRVNKPYTRLSINRQLLLHLRNFHECEKKKRRKQKNVILTTRIYDIEFAMCVRIRCRIWNSKLNRFHGKLVEVRLWSPTVETEFYISLRKIVEFGEIFQQSRNNTRLFKTRTRRYVHGSTDTNRSYLRGIARSFHTGHY